jgi:N-hydroxyarylamine O-acetyltransferase
MTNPVRLQAYFDRIGYCGACHPDTEVLAALQKAHVCSVPFENLDVQFGRTLTTAVDAAYDKIVGLGRGGWCYEQNGLFGWALAEIGFDVTRIAAAVMRHERGEISEANHLCLLVRVPDSDEIVLADVGFGGSMLRPIRLCESEHEQAPFRIGLRRLDDGYWRFWEETGGAPFSYDFVPEPANEIAMAHRCTYLQSDPASGFVLNAVVQLRLPEEHKVLRGRIFRLATSAGTRSRILHSADELVATLADQFRLDVPEAADLWPRIAERHAQLLRQDPLIEG